MAEDKEKESIKTDNPNVERKVDKKKETEKKQTELFKSSGQKNVLNAYRSYTYNFTLFAAYKNDINVLNLTRSEAELVVLKSGGKGLEGINNPSAEEVITKENAYKTAKSAKDSKDKDARKKAKGELEDLKLVQGFNQDSPGRFDMFIDDIEIETIMAFNKNGGTTQPTKLRFEIIEPYSINGFIEALHVAAVRAGYPNYTTASFVLKIEFIGYPDTDDFSDPEIVQKSTRYFLIGFTGMEVEVTERGTKYVCSAVPFNEKAFGQPGKLKKPVKMEGETVRELLEDLMKNMTEQEIQNAKKSGTEKYYDEYKVTFLKQAGQGWEDDKSGVIASSKLADLGTDSALYQMVNPSDTKKKNNYKTTDQSSESSKNKSSYEPKKSVTQFPENVNLHEVMAAIIRDSEYVSNIIKKMPLDDDGMVEYFNIRVQVTNKEVINSKTKKPNQTYDYIVTPFRIHFTAIPNTENIKVDEKKLKRSTLREYNYIYTGLNTDVRNFRLNFNNLYFEAIPADMGKKDTPSSKVAARPGNKSERTYKENPPDSTSSVPESSQRTDPAATSVLPPSGYNAGLPKNDPYSVMARGMHEKLINSTNLLTGELDIIGDPLYLVTGGITNQTPAMVSYIETSDGEAAHIRGQVLIAINFRNPIDIKSFENGGMMYFDSNRIPFSGVYQVLDVKSSFKDGQFLQKLNITRVPGQIIDQNLEPEDPRDFIIDSPYQADQVKADVTQALDFGQRVDSDSLAEQFGRGIPTPGNPGEDINFSGAVGGLGGDNSSLKSQIFGALASFGNLESMSSQVGLPLFNDFSRNIRVNQLGLANLSQISLENASKVKSTVDTLFAAKNQNVIKSLASDLINDTLVNSSKVPFKGSGIGDGAYNKINQEDLAVGSDNLSYVSGIAKNLNSFNISKVSNLVSKESSAIFGGVNDKVSSLLESKSDPNALGSRINLDVNKISGLGGDLSSKASNQISEFKNLPDNVNLTEEVSRGLRLEYFSSSDLKNLPPTQPLTSAPPPDVNSSYINSVVSRGGEQALANLYGVSSVNKISESVLSKRDVGNALENIPSSQQNPYSNLTKDFNSIDSKILQNRIDNSKVQLNPLVGDPLIKDQNFNNSVSSKFGSKTIGKNPLDKLLNTTPNLGI